MVAGALIAPRAMAVLRFGVVIAIGPVVGLAAALAMASTAIWPSPTLAAASFFLFGIGPIVWVVATATLRQAVTPSRLLGRVSAVNILSYGARPAGSALGAAVAALGGTEACLWAAAGLFAAQAAVILVSPVARLEERPAIA